MFIAAFLLACLFLLPQRPGTHPSHGPEALER
jgi:hypothetical protein